MKKSNCSHNRSETKNDAFQTSRGDVYALFCACFLGKAQRTIGLQLLLALILFLIFRVGWASLRSEIGDQDDFVLGLNDVTALSKPIWIPPAFEEEAIRSETKLNEKRLSLLDSKTGDDLVRAFQAHPWVRNVRSVQLEYPAKAWIRLEYRTPIAFVEIDDHSSRSENGVTSRSSYQVDSDGFLLPTDYLAASVASNSNAIYDYLWILGIESTPIGTYGQSWGDPILDEAVLLAEFLNNDFKSLGIQKIIVPSEEETTGDRPLDKPKEKRIYRLETIRGKQIIWGNFSMMGVISARDQSKALYDDLKAEAFQKETPKLNELKNLAEQNGSLDSLPGERFPLDLSDVTGSKSAGKD